MSLDERIPPHDLAAERAVLGSLLIDYKFAWPLVEAVGLRTSDFFHGLHQDIFRRLSLWAWSGRQPDYVTIRDSVAGQTRQGKARYDPAEVGDYVLQLADATPSAANADFYAKAVKDRATRRGLIRAASQTIQAAYEDGPENTVAQDIQFALDDLERLREQGLVRTDLPTVDGNRILAEPPPPRDLLVGHGLLALGEWLLILGEPKAGKSMLALDLAAELVRDPEANGSWVGLNVFPGRRVLYLGGEGGQRAMYARWKKRSQGLGKHERARFFAWYPTPYLMDITTADEYLQLERFITDNAIELLVVDPLAHFHNGSENDAGDMKIVAGQFIRLLATTGCASVVVHHTRKPQITSRRGSPLEGRGSTALFGASDGAIMMEFEGDQEDPERRLTFTPRHAEEYIAPEIVELNRQLLRFEVCARDLGGRSQKDGLTVDDFLGWVEEKGKPFFQRDAAATTGISLRSVQRWTKELVDAGKLARWREASNKAYRYGFPKWFEPQPKQASLPGVDPARQTDEGGVGAPTRKGRKS